MAKKKSFLVTHFIICGMEPKDAKKLRDKVIKTLKEDKK